MRKQMAALVARALGRAFRFRRAAVAALALAGTALVFGAPADLARGIAWLQAQVQTNGGLLSGSRAAAATQAQCETATTLLRLAGNSSQIASLIAALQPQGADDATESLACWQRLRQQLGQSILGADIELRRVSQQGYAAFEGFGVPSALDSGWAFAAQLQNLSATDKSNLLAWLQASQAADGSFATAGRADLAATAIVLRGLQEEAAKSAAAGAIATRAAGWLLGQRNAQGNWLSDIGTTALAFEAVHPYTGNDPTVASAVEGYLLAQQQADGSWQGDAYVTALALRALALTSVQPIDPTLAASASVRGAVTLASTGQPLGGVSVTAQPASGSARSAVTDAQGNYLVQGVTPGGISLSASLAGYETISAQVTVDGGAVAVFSPAMYLTGTPAPTGARIKGRVQAFGSGAALPGATVQAEGVTAQTDALGAFDIAVSAGSHTVTYSLAGYDSQAQQVALSGGSTADVGVVVLKPARTTSSLRGSVFDLQGQPIAGATVAVQGGPSAVSNSAGAYSIGELGGLQFAIQASATGYAARNVSLAISQPGDVVQDFRLPSLTAAYLNLSDLTLASQTAGLRKDVTATAIISNPSAAAATAMGSAIVTDPQGQRIASLAALDASGLPLPSLTLQPGEQKTLYYKWNTGTFAPGTYTFMARLQLPETVDRNNPDGVVLASQQQLLAISAGSSFFGSVTADPPVLRAGTNTPVKLTALIQNGGNVTLPAQNYRLAIIDTASGQATLTQTIGSEDLPVAQLRSLDFGDWTPQGGGNFRLELTAASTAGALVTTTLYVGDSGTATFTVDKSFVPAGDQKVRGSITVTGQSVVNGTINDPLVPLVRQAIQTAVAKADTIAYDHYLSPTPGVGKCFLCHVQTQALVGGERNLRHATPVDPIKRTTLLNGITQYIRASGEINHDNWAIMINTTLGLWAVSEWHDQGAVALSKRLMANYLMSTQDPTGFWRVEHDATWWRTKTPLVALNLGSFATLKAAVLGGELPTMPVLTQKPITGLPQGDFRMQADSDGTLYVAVGGSIYKIPPNGTTATLLVAGLKAYSAYPIGSGRLITGGDLGIHVVSPTGVATKVTSTPTHDVQPYGTDRYLVSFVNGRTVKILEPDGSLTPLIDDDLFGGFALPPVQMPDGNLLVGGYYGQQAGRFTPQGRRIDIPIRYTTSKPFNTIAYRDGIVVSTETGLYYFNKEWAVERWDYNRVVGTVRMPDGRLLVNCNGRLCEVTTPQADAAAFASSLESSIVKSTKWLQDGIGSDANNNIDVAFRLMGLGKAKKHFKGTPRENEFDVKMAELGQTLRARQRADGGWLWKQGTTSCTNPVNGSCSDPMVTAMVGIALDTLDPSPSSPVVRNAITFLLGQQKADGMWYSVNRGSAGLADTPLLASTWVEIWLPTMLERLGGIDTDLSLNLPASVALSNPDRTPTSSVTATDGSSSYVWKLIGVTETSQRVNFDLTLKGMQVDEVRPVAQQANLVFTNSFVPGSVTAAINIPNVAVGTSLAPAVKTDKPVYTEVDQAIFTGTASNAGTSARDAQVRLTVLNASGEVVEVLPLGPSISVPGSGTASIAQQWPVSGILSGDYVVRADLYSPAGLLYGSATATFAVTASQVQTTSARINADRVSYSAAQSVQVTSRVANNTSNTALENLQARTDVRSAGGTSVFSRTEPIDQLAAGGSRQYGYSVGAGTLAPGNYGATLQLLAGNGSVLAQSTTSFSVLGADQTGIGITGQLQALPDVLFVGQNTHLTLQVTNNSTVSLSSVPLTVRIVDPVTASVVASFTATAADWAASQNRSFGFDWSAAGEHGQVMVAAASALVAGKEVPLAQANLKILGILFTGAVAADPREVEAGDKTVLNYGVTNPTGVAGRMTGNLAVQTQAGQTLSTWPLDLSIAGLGSFAGNQLYTTGEQLQTLTAVLSQQLGTSTSVLATTSFTVIDRPVPLDVNTGLKGQARILVLVSCPPGLGTADDAACVAQRSQAIVTYFGGLGLTTKAVATREAFLAEMRCGSYNTYWISGGAMKLDEQTVGELREAVYRGEALWMDGLHDSRNQLLHPAAGVKEIGKLPASNQVESSTEQGIYGAGELPTMGQPTKFELTTGQVQGLFTQVPGQQAPVPAIVSNDHGRGKSLLFAFDLAAMVTADAVQANSQLAGLVTTSASYGASASPTLTLGDVTQLSASINNQGTRTVSFKAEATLPAPLASIATAPQALLLTNADGSTLATWNFSLAGGATQELGWLVRGMQTGSFNVPLSIYSMPSAGSSLPPKLRVTTTFVVDVKDAANLLQQPLAAASALEPTASSDKSNKTKALDAIAQARALHAQGSYEQAIVQWLAAADALIGITSADTAAARGAVSLALEATTDALCIQRCGTAACQ